MGIKPNYIARPWALLKGRTLINVKGANGEQICQIPMEHAGTASLLVGCVNDNGAAADAFERAANLVENLNETGCDLPGIVGYLRDTAKRERKAQLTKDPL